MSAPRSPLAGASRVSAIVACAAFMVLAMAGWSGAVRALVWIASPGRLVVERPSDLFLHALTASAALSCPFVLGWGIAALYGWRTRAQSGVAILAWTAGAPFSSMLVVLAARIGWARAALASSDEPSVIRVSDLDHFTYALAAALAAAAITLGIAVHRSRR